jgi:hypothetical protein
MGKGIKSLREAVQRDTKQYNNCFNENGCDHEFIRIVPETNPGLIKMGIKTCCKMVSKCSHKYCDRYKWVIYRAKYYEEKTGRSFEEVIEIWENNRTYWYMNYYQDCNQPLNGIKPDDEQLNALRAKIPILENEIESWIFAAESLTYDHQKSIKLELNSKAEQKELELKELKCRLQLLELRMFLI